VWKGKAVDKCKEQEMTLKNYGVLIPCDTGKFTGVEFVCCPKNMMTEVLTDNVHVVPLVGVGEDVDQPLPKSTPKPTTFLEKLEQEVKKFSKHLTGKSIGKLQTIKTRNYCQTLPPQILSFTTYRLTKY
jgi:amyloid beta A4 protein